MKAEIRYFMLIAKVVGWCRGLSAIFDYWHDRDGRQEGIA